MMAFRRLLSFQEIRRNLLFICLAIAASLVLMISLALLNDEFPAVAGRTAADLEKRTLIFVDASASGHRKDLRED